jgi:hypothetical protein
MHDQAASRISGRTRAAVSAMCVRAVRITVLKSAGNFTRDESHGLNAEKIQPVKCFMFTRCGICCVPAIFERRRGRLGSKISAYRQLAEVAVYFATSGLPPASRHQSKGRHVRWVPHIRTLAPQRDTYSADHLIGAREHHRECRTLLFDSNCAALCERHHISDRRSNVTCWRRARAEFDRQR